MRATTTRPLISAAALGAAGLLALTGCSVGSSAASGSYYGGSDSYGYPGIIVVEGDKITWGEFACDEVGQIDKTDSDTSIGTLSGERTIIAWTQSGRYSNSSPFTESEDGSVIIMSGQTYSKAGTDAGDAILTEQELTCKENADRQKEREAKKAEQAEADAQMKPAFDKALDALFEAAKAGKLSDLETLDDSPALAQNGISEEEFDLYLRRNYGGMAAYELLRNLQGDPTVAREILDEYASLSAQ